MTEFRDRYFKGSSRSAGNVGDLVAEKYDLALLSSSWDSRCVVICDVKEVKIGKVILLLPEERDELNLRSKHDQQLADFCKLNAESIFEIVGSTYSPEETWLSIYQFIVSSQGLEFPIENALVDLSTTCRYYSLGLVALLLRLGLVRRIDVIYAECTYDDSQSDVVEFTDGAWEKRVIPFLDGSGNPASPEFWLLSCGFEGLKTRRFVRRDEPDRIHLLLPYPGFSQEYEKRSLSEAEPLISEFGLQEDDISKVSAADAVEVWRDICSLESKWISDQQVSYVCGGTKPHSLGLALHALSSRNPAVFYIRPDSYKVVETKVSGNYWVYSIEDLSRIPL